MIGYNSHGTSQLKNHMNVYYFFHPDKMCVMETTV